MGGSSQTQRVALDLQGLGHGARLGLRGQPGAVRELVEEILCFAYRYDGRCDSSHYEYTYCSSWYYDRHYHDCQLVSLIPRLSEPLLSPIHLP